MWVRILISEYLYKIKLFNNMELRKFIKTTIREYLNEQQILNEMKIIKKENLTQEEKLEELNKIIKKYGIMTNNGTIRTYEDYLKFKEENPNFKYQKLDDELNSKKEKINFIFIKKKG